MRAALSGWPWRRDSLLRVPLSEGSRFIGPRCHRCTGNFNRSVPRPARLEIHRCQPQRFHRQRLSSGVPFRFRALYHHVRRLTTRSSEQRLAAASFPWLSPSRQPLSLSLSPLGALPLRSVLWRGSRGVPVPSRAASSRSLRRQPVSSGTSSRFGHAFPAAAPVIPPPVGSLSSGLRPDFRRSRA